MEYLKSEIKNIIIFVAILGGLYLVYTFFFAGDSSSPTTITAAQSGSGSVGGEVLPILLDLQKIKLDDSIFSDTTFKQLKNFSVELFLNEADKGRVNPFAPLDGVSASSSTQINVSVGTLRN